MISKGPCNSKVTVDPANTHILDLRNVVQFRGRNNEVTSQTQLLQTYSQRGGAESLSVTCSAASTLQSWM